MVFQSSDNSISDFDYQALVQGLDQKGIAAVQGMIALHMQQGSFTYNDLTQTTGLSPTEAKNRVKPFEKENVLVAGSKPNDLYPNMRPAKLYCFASGIDIDQLQVALNTRLTPPSNKDSNNKTEGKEGVSSTERNLQSSNAPKTREALRNVFQTISPLYRPAHIQILVWIAEFGSITAKKASEKSGTGPSTSNAQLERVRNLGVIYRERRSGEYHYFLVPGLDKDLVASFFREDAYQDLPVINTQSENIEPKAIQLVADMSSPENLSDPQHSQDEVSFATLVDQFMEVMAKVPACNENWPQSLQTTWVNAFERVTRVLDRAREINETE